MAACTLPHLILPISIDCLLDLGGVLILAVLRCKMAWRQGHHLFTSVLEVHARSEMAATKIKDAFT